MAIVELIGSHLQRLHEALETATTDLTTEQLHWQPPAGGNHVAFSLWHYVRTEDNLVRFVLQERGLPCGWRMAGTSDSGWNAWHRGQA